MLFRSPSFLRRTVYGKVSRYKLDTFLQTFDFPPPNISAEKRFTTTVPLQRLFLMNSDFMQIEAEELAKRVASEPDNRARVKKLYQLAYGRDPNEKEIALAIDYLHSEPLKEYEDNKNKPAENPRGRGRGGPGQQSGAVKTPAPIPAGVIGKPDASAAAMPEDAAKPPVEKVADKPAEAKLDEAKTEETKAEEAKPEEPKADSVADMPAEGGDMPMGMGMMGGVPGMGGPGGRRGNGPAGPAVPKYDPTAWGRYAKIVLSASEFMFIN